jgi:NNP family nitrate/nitrite transporter-like MFS transporter
MTATITTPTDNTASAPKTGRWITDWRPEDPEFWESTGRRVARRNLIMSIFTEHVGFSIWTIWSVFVLFLGPKYGLSKLPKDVAAEKFLLTSLPAALGSIVRLPYTFAVAKFGGRNWTIVSALLLLVPLIVTGLLLKPGVGYGELLVLAALAGVGGGNFASSMTNINSFYPQRLKGAALGLNAGGGNIGVAVVQLVGLLVLATAGKEHPRLLVGIYLPLVVLGIAGAALCMDNIADVRNEKRAIRDACKDVHTWIVSFLYIGTFGSFIGFGFAFGQVLSSQFGSHFIADGKVDAVKVAYLTFLGPLVGSLIRPVGGWLADRVGGANTTFWNFAGMVAAGSLVLAASKIDSLGLFYVGFLMLFVLSGIGNGSIYKMIPTIFAARTDTARQARRITNAVIGIAGAIGAFGGVLVNVAFRQSFLSSGTGDAAYIAFIVCYALCLVLTWAAYLRRPVSSPAH